MFHKLQKIKSYNLERSVCGLSAETITAISTAMTSFGSTLLEYFVQLLAPLAGIAAIGFVISIIRRKVRA